MFICTNDQFCPNRAEAFESVEHFQSVCEAASGVRADIREHFVSLNWYSNTTGELVLRHVEPSLHDYATGDYIREATAAELDESLEAASYDGGAGVIEVDGRACYVED